MALIGTDIVQASNLLKAGDVVAIPTETVYGLAANALDKSAVLKIYEIKNRPSFDPLIIHVSAISEIEKYAVSIPEQLKDFAELTMPGPLTLLLPKKSLIPDLVTSGLDRVAIRVPKHPLTLDLLSNLDFPLAAPSANPFGYISPTSAQHVNAQLGDKIPYILDGGACSVGIESTIIGIENDEIIVYRLGGLSIDYLEKYLGKITLAINQSSNPKSPGQIKSHYAPKKPFLLGNIEALIETHHTKKIGVLIFGPHNLSAPNLEIYNLSESENTFEAAMHLFDYMRKLDDSEVELIVADFLPQTGLGKAINDRLQRAAAK